MENANLFLESGPENSKCIAGALNATEPRLSAWSTPRAGRGTRLAGSNSRYQVFWDTPSGCPDEAPAPGFRCVHDKCVAWPSGLPSQAACERICGPLPPTCPDELKKACGGARSSLRRGRRPRRFAPPRFNRTRLNPTLGTKFQTKA